MTSLAGELLFEGVEFLFKAVSLLHSVIPSFRGRRERNLLLSHHR
jgi:hypothetical protein